MLPDDPRHGTTAGHNTGCRCLPCCSAKLRYDKRRRLDAVSGLHRRIPAWRAIRRLNALQALGWPLRRLESEIGVTFRSLSTIRQQSTVTAATFEAICEAYERLSMSPPVADTVGELSGMARTRNAALRNGWLPPLAWNDIDDPDERPTVTRDRTWGDGDWQDYVDHAVVWRVINEQTSPRKLTRAEATEVTRILLSRGTSTFEIENTYGIKPERYKGAAA